MPEEPPLAAQIVVGADQVFAARIGIGDLRSVIETLVRHALSVGLGKPIEDRHTGRVQAVRWNDVARKDAAQRIFQLRDRIAVLIDALGKIALALEQGREGGVAAILRLQLLLELLAPEEKQLVLLGVEEFRDVQRTADRIAGVIEPEQVTREAIAIVLPVVGIQALMPMEPVAASVEVAGTALGDHRDLGA